MYMQQLAGQLGQLVDMHVVVHRSEEEWPLEHAQVHYLTLSWNFWRVRREYKQILAEVRPDVVHVNCCWHPYFAYAAIWAREEVYKVVLTPHGMLEPWIMSRNYWTRKLPSLLLYQRRAVRMTTLLHATAEMERQHLLQLGWNTNVTVIANGIEVEKIAIRTEWQRRGTLLYLGRIHPKKGVDELIRALGMMARAVAEDGMKADTGAACAACGELRLLIAGEGEQEYVMELKRLARECGVEEHVQWLGGVYGDEKWRLMREADALVLPTHSENFGIVVAEAMASGTPVITTHGTPWQCLEQEHCGWWIPYGAEPLFLALKALEQCSTLERRALGLNGRRVVEEKFSTREVAKGFVRMYEGISGG